MFKVFISYSRKDGVFARQLVDALNDLGLETWIDWASIPYSEDWWRKIEAGIDGAHNFVFIISPDSLQSEICNKEVAYARARGKRVIPAIHRDVLNENGKPLGTITSAWFNEKWADMAEDNWQALGKLNWLFFRQEDDFNEALERLVQTGEKDPEHIHHHTRLLQWAREWERQSHNLNNLLRGDDLINAKNWLEDSQQKDPSPTDLHRLYIDASQLAENKRKRRILGLAILVMFLVLVGMVSSIQALSARIEIASAGHTLVAVDTRVAESETELKRTEALRLAAISQGILNSDGDPETAAL